MFEGDDRFVGCWFVVCCACKMTFRDELLALVDLEMTRHLADVHGLSVAPGFAS